MSHSRKHELLVILLGVCLFIPFLGAAHLFDWDEINFAEAAREMIASGNYLQVQIDFQPFWEKPPLFLWMQVLSMKIFGINEFGARFPNALCGVVTLLVLFRIGRSLKDVRFGWLWAGLYAGSLLPHVYFKSGIIDPWFNLFIFLSLYFFIQYTRTGFSVRQLFYSGIFLGLAVMTKGPASVLVLVLTFAVYLVMNRFKLFLPAKHIFLYITFVILTLLPWLSIEIIQNGTWFIWEFTKYQFQLASSDVAGHKGFFGYHFVVIFFLCFPASVFGIPAMFKKNDADEMMRLFRKWMLILFWVVLILFSVIQTKIAHYSSLTYFPLTFLAAYTLYHVKEKWNTGMSVLLVFGSLAIFISLTVIPYILSSQNLPLQLFKDKFSQAVFSGGRSFSGYESLTGILFMIGILITVYLNSKRKSTPAIYTLLITTTITIAITIVLFTPRIEYYSQRPMINYLTEKKDEDCYLDVLGFKSYAYIFYGERKEADTRNAGYMNWLDAKRTELGETNTWPSPDEYRKYFRDWLLRGDIDKPAYFIVKVPAANQYLTNYPQLLQVDQQGGYVLLMRDVK